uniref:Uncharacterized protein n=1 Tax=Populus trichocarpa TaxID=3694 RepID=U5GQZ9_POPTR
MVVGISSSGKALNTEIIGYDSPNYKGYTSSPTRMQVMWMSYSKERLVVALAVCTSGMDIWTIVWDAQRNEIFIEMHHVITDKEYMIWYICITRWIITLDPEQVGFLLGQGRETGFYLRSTNEESEVHTVASQWLNVCHTGL